MPLFDLHMHSRYSFDGIMSPRHMVELARRKGLAGISVSDHNTISGGVEARAANHDPDFLVIVGAEIQTEIGDILGLFLSQEIKSRISTEVIEEIHHQGGIAILPHPYAYHQNLSGDVLRLFDGVEIYNGRDKRDYASRAYAEFVKPFGLAPVANSDAHLYWEIGRACTSLDIEQVNNDSVRKAILNGKTTPIRHEDKRSTIAVYSSKVIKRVKRIL